MRKFSLQKIHDFLVGLWAISLLLSLIAFVFISFFAWLPTVFNEIPSRESLREVSGILLSIEKNHGVGSIPPHYTLILRTENGEFKARLEIGNIGADWEKVLDERKPLKQGMQLTLSIDDRKTPWIYELRTGKFVIISHQYMQALSKHVRQSSGNTLILLLKIISLLGLLGIIHQKFLKGRKKNSEIFNERIRK